MAERPVGAALGRRFPGLRSVRGYRRAWLIRDVIAGVSVVAYLVPQVMAYATLAGLPAVQGLWAVPLALVAYAFLGSSRTLSVGPESSTALLVGTALAPLAALEPVRAVPLAALLAVLTGVVTLVARVFRAGYLAGLLSRPILVGYMAGIAVLMIIGQLEHVTGVAIPDGTPWSEIMFLVGHLDLIRPAPSLIAVGVVAIIAVGFRWRPRLPWTLAAVGFSTAAVAAGALDRFGASTVGAVPTSLPLLGLPTLRWSDVELLLPAAVGIAVVGFADTVLTARSFADPHDPPVDANQELLALGAANLAAGLSHGMPVSSSGSRTAIAHLIGARSQVYAIVAASLLIIVLLVGGSVLSAFPLAALGGLVVYAATRLVDVVELGRMARFRVSELVLALATAAAVLLVGVLPGIAVAIALSVADLLRRLARPHDATLALVPGLAGMHAQSDYPAGSQVPGLVIYRYDSPLFFANADDFRRRAHAAVDAAACPVRWFVLDAEAISEIDLTAADELERLRRELCERGIVVGTAHVRRPLARLLTRTGFVQQIGADRMFATMPTAVEAYRRWLDDRQSTESNVPPTRSGAAVTGSG